MDDKNINRYDLIENVKNLSVTLTMDRLPDAATVSRFAEEYKASVIKLIEEAPVEYDVDDVYDKIYNCKKSIVSIEGINYIPLDLVATIVLTGKGCEDYEPRFKSTQNPDEYVSIYKLISMFIDMASRRSLLCGANVSQEDILTQIIGTIVKASMDSKRVEDYDHQNTR